MSLAFDEFITALDELRVLRDTRRDTDDAESRMTDRLDLIWNAMGEADQQRADAEWWRAWPDEYAARMATSLRDQDLWNAKHADPPRTVVEAA
jgi:hypothetical protein